MGCANGKSAAKNVFKVSESKFGEGKLEINSKEMIFYKKGCEKKDDMKIPFSLKHLRRYGVDLETNIFCFEAGRSCVTGEGIYAFKSHHANSLFEILKSYIEGIDSSTNEDVDVLFTNNLRETHDHLDETLNSLRSLRTLGQNDGYTTEPRSITHNRKTFQIRMSSVSGMSPQIESSETPFLYENQYIENNNSIEAVPSSSYVNVDVTATATTPKSCKSVFFDETISRNYENVQETQNTPTSKDPPELPTSPNELTYTVLELVQEEACQQEVQEKTQRPPILTKSFSTGSGTNTYNGKPLLQKDGQNKEPFKFNYAVIDFDKTNALATATANSNTSTGVRKTRHHSEDNFLFEKSRSILLGI